MRVEFNNNGFSANMNSSYDHEQHHGEKISELPFRGFGVLLLGIIAIAFSVIELPLGLFINISYDALSSALGITAMHWAVVLFAISVIIAVMSVACGIIAIVCYSKSAKQTVDVVGMVLSIIAFIISTFCLILNIVGFILW